MSTSCTRTAVAAGSSPLSDRPRSLLGSTQRLDHPGRALHHPEDGGLRLREQRQGDHPQEGEEVVMTDVKTLAIRLDSDLHNRLTILAKLTGISITDAIRTAIEKEVDSMAANPETATKQRTSRTPSPDRPTSNAPPSRHCSAPRRASHAPRASPRRADRLARQLHPSTRPGPRLSASRSLAPALYQSRNTTSPPPNCRTILLWNVHFPLHACI